MTAATIWQLLFVDDDPDFCRQVQEFLESETIPPDGRLQVATLNDFGDALNELEIRRFDLLILDVRLGPHSSMPDEEAGITTLQAIRQRRFIPVVFYTGLPHLVRHLVTPLVQVVEKTEELPRLLDSPFAEALLARFARYFGRLGTPDLDVAVLLQRLRTVIGERTE